MTPPDKRGHRNAASKSSEIERRLAAGESPIDIAGALDVTANYVYAIRKDMGVGALPAAELQARIARLEIQYARLAARVEDIIVSGIAEPISDSLIRALSGVVREALSGPPEPRQVTPAELADRDAKILAMIASGHKPARICADLGVTKHMIKDAKRRTAKANAARPMLPEGEPA